MGSSRETISIQEQESPDQDLDRDQNSRSPDQDLDHGPISSQDPESPDQDLDRDPNSIQDPISIQVTESPDQDLDRDPKSPDQDQVLNLVQGLRGLGLDLRGPGLVR